MFTKVLLCLLPLFYVQVWSLPCDDFRRDEVFVCENIDKQIVTIYGQDFRCNFGFMCNANYQPVQTRCNPCIQTEYVCGDIYTCSMNKLQFTMEDTTFDCPPDFVCNESKRNGCEPCIFECNPDNWECVDDITVIIDGVEILCPDGKVCNQDKISPCEPCIPKPIVRIPSIFMPTN